MKERVFAIWVCSAQLQGACDGETHTKGCLNLRHATIQTSPFNCRNRRWITKCSIMPIPQGSRPRVSPFLQNKTFPHRARHLKNYTQLTSPKRLLKLRRFTGSSPSYMSNNECYREKVLQLAELSGSPIVTGTQLLWIFTCGGLGFFSGVATLESHMLLQANLNTHSCKKF